MVVKQQKRGKSHTAESLSLFLTCFSHHG